jgi:hypothetical protein
MPGTSTGSAPRSASTPRWATATGGSRCTCRAAPRGSREATHVALGRAGVDVDAEISRMGDPIPPMFWLRDPDANVLMVAENPAG